MSSAGISPLPTAKAAHSIEDTQRKRFACFVGKVHTDKTTCQDPTLYWETASALIRSRHLLQHTGDGSLPGFQLIRLRELVDLFDISNRVDHPSRFSYYRRLVYAERQRSGISSLLSPTEAWRVCFLQLYPEFAVLRSQLDPTSGKPLIRGLVNPRHLEAVAFLETGTLVVIPKPSRYRLPDDLKVEAAKRQPPQPPLLYRPSSLMLPSAGVLKPGYTSAYVWRQAYTWSEPQLAAAMVPHTVLASLLSRPTRALMPSALPICRTGYSTGSSTTRSWLLQEILSALSVLALDKIPITDMLQSEPQSSRRELMSLKKTKRLGQQRAEYVYWPLHLDQPHFRTVRILPGDVDSPIHCIIRTTTPSQPYYALSHTWGDSHPKNRIFLNGHLFSVRDNLYAFLLHARSLQIQHEIFIDAICINENDSAEKNHQVAQVAEIYRNAVLVYVWLRSVGYSYLLLGKSSEGSQRNGSGKSSPNGNMPPTKLSAQSKKSLPSWALWTDSVYHNRRSTSGASEHLKLPRLVRSSAFDTYSNEKYIAMPIVELNPVLPESRSSSSETAGLNNSQTDMTGRDDLAGRSANSMDPIDSSASENDVSLGYSKSVLSDESCDLQSGLMLPAAILGKSPRSMSTLAPDLVSSKSISDRLKCFIEYCLDQKMVWWPLNEPTRTIGHGTIRYSFQCRCGPRSYIDLPSSNAEKDSQQLPDETVDAESYAVPAGPVSATAPGTTLSTSGSILTGLQSIPMAYRANSRLSQRPVKTQNTSPRLISVAPAPRPQKAGSWIYWCIQGRDRNHKVVDINAAASPPHPSAPRPYMTAGELSRQLLLHYRKHTNWLFRLLTVSWCTSGVLSEFVYIGIGATEDTTPIGMRRPQGAVSPELPNQLDYDYEKFGSAPSFNIQKAYLQAAMRHYLVEHVRFQWPKSLTSPIACVPDDNGVCDLANFVDYIPKKSPLSVPKARGEGAHCLEACTELSFIKIMILLSLNFVVCIVFAVVYIRLQPDDWEKGVVPLGLLLTGVPVYLGLLVLWKANMS